MSTNDPQVTPIFIEPDEATALYWSCCLCPPDEVLTVGTFVLNPRELLCNPYSDAVRQEYPQGSREGEATFAPGAGVTNPRLIRLLRWKTFVRNRRTLGRPPGLWHVSSESRSAPGGPVVAICGRRLPNLLYDVSIAPPKPLVLCGSCERIVVTGATGRGATIKIDMYKLPEGGANVAEVTK